PFAYESGKPLLLVNRGWAAKTSEGAGLPDLPAGDGNGSPAVTVRGKAGQLPRVGIRAGEAFTGDANWPRTANWPTLAELAQALSHDVLPFVLLADPEPGSGMIRRWEPRQVGPARHVGYAFQWFALAAAVVVTTLVLYRKKRRARQ
ncbi:MAG: SURF1 family cytochrome oxidase biogenesis protein, partial [Woeseiaceae bacterium]